MALSRKTVLDKIEISENSVINVRYSKKIIDDDGITEISHTFHREIFFPGLPLETIPDGPIRAIANLLWTEEVIIAYKNSIEKGKPFP